MLFGDLLGAPGVLRGWFFGGAGFSFHALARLLLSFLLVSKTHQVLRWLCQDSTAPDTDEQKVQNFVIRASKLTPPCAA